MDFYNDTKHVHIKLHEKENKILIIHEHREILGIIRWEF